MTKIHKYRVRYVEGEQYRPPNEKLVCPHLMPEDDEQVYEDDPKSGWNIATMLANDPGWSNNYQVRYCQGCADMLTAEEETLAIVRKQREMLRVYKLGLEDGYVQGKAKDQTAEVTADFRAFDKLCKEAQAFADTQGDQFFQEYVLGVNYNADGTRSRGWCHPINQDAFDMDGNLRSRAFIPNQQNQQNPN